MLVVIVGIFISILMGKAGLETKPDRTMTEEAGATLLADGLVSDMELAAEIIPDLIDGDKPKGKKQWQVKQ